LLCFALLFRCFVVLWQQSRLLASHTKGVPTTRACQPNGGSESNHDRRSSPTAAEIFGTKGTLFFVFFSFSFTQGWSTFLLFFFFFFFSFGLLSVCVSSGASFLLAGRYFFFFYCFGIFAFPSSCLLLTWSPNKQTNKGRKERKQEREREKETRTKGNKEQNRRKNGKERKKRKRIRKEKEKMF